MGNIGRMKKVLLTNGDSWTFGSEIMAPEFCVPKGTVGTGMAGRYKQGYDDWKPYNDYYRVPRIWPTYLAENLDIPTVVNLARPARSNDTIYEHTIDWILENYITKKKSTKGLLVVLGWSSPERKNITISDEDGNARWLTLWPQMATPQFYSSSVIKRFLKFYITYQWIEQEYLKRFVEHNYNFQNFCKLHKIDYYVFNSFYSTAGTNPKSWKDVSIPDSINSWDNLINGWSDEGYDWNSIKRTLLTQWNLIDETRYINKDLGDGSFRAHIYKHVPDDIRMCNWHPSPESHHEWAKFLSDYIRCNQK